MRTLIVGGRGQVGSALSGRLSSLGHSVAHFNSTDDRASFMSKAIIADVVFVAIPSDGTGGAALGYYMEALSIGKPVITCEKAALAYHFVELKPHLHKIGYTAVVGGGSRMLSLFDFPYLCLEWIVGIVNGTLNFLFHECANGDGSYEVLARAQEMGLCERGASDLASTVNAEIRDMALKMVNIFNFSGVSGEILCADQVGSLRLSEVEIIGALKRGTKRFAVAISREHRLSKDCLYDCICVHKGGWYAEAALADVSILPFTYLPRRQENALSIEDYGGNVQIFGPGAGPGPTAEAMIGDMGKVLS